METHAILCCALVLVAAGPSLGCSGVTTFRGAEPISIAGTPPPPPAPAARVEVRNNEIVIHEKVQFDFDKATIKPVSHGLLDEVADVIQKNPQIKRIEVQGHASSEGSADHNQKLSDARASAVMTYLLSKAIANDRLTSKGYGVTKPIADNATEEGREQNRRVQFVILAQDVTEKKVEIDPSTGKERVLEEKHAEKTQ
jgi:OOP family OmpA-OmpF porin